MHPYDASGWKRPVVWPHLGFEKTMFIDDFKYTSDDLYREYVSDKCAYENLITEINNKKEGEKTFTFLVTMQNHGGYTDIYENFPIPQTATRVFSGELTQVNTYIELVRKSDEALEMLVNYLKEQDEKYVLVVFGDHQPAINAFTNNMAPGKTTSWAVPYLVWTNYDMDETLYNSQFEQNTDTSSINYLALTTMDAAGIKYPAYYQLISKFREEVPSINAVGFYSNEKKEFNYHDNATAQKDIDVLKKYNYLQYSIIFDKNTNKLEDKLQNTISSVKK